MFQAKNKGRSRVEVFDESLRAKSVARLEIYDDLRHSIDHDELTVHYQPIASVKDDRIVAMEALVRWHHPSRGLLGPMEFIPFAEETDLIFTLGRWVLREACQTMAKWRRELPGAEDAYVTVNLSAHQLSDTELLDTIASALADSGLPPEALVMEVTESMLMSDTSASIAMLGGIHEMGVGLAIDDFGTGYSSLAQLKRFPVKILKIDKSFVDGLGTFENDEAIVAAIVQLSKALDLVVLAEGVETPDPAGAGVRTGLRPLPGLPDVPAHPGRPGRLQQAGVGQRRLQLVLPPPGADRPPATHRWPDHPLRPWPGGARPLPSRSMMVALACPPPSHMVWSP